jgi:hypothetical protein
VNLPAGQRDVAVAAHHRHAVLLLLDRDRAPQRRRGVGLGQELAELALGGLAGGHGLQPAAVGRIVDERDHVLGQPGGVDLLLLARDRVRGDLALALAGQLDRLAGLLLRDRLEAADQARLVEAVQAQDDERLLVALHHHGEVGDRGRDVDLAGVLDEREGLLGVGLAGEQRLDRRGVELGGAHGVEVAAEDDRGLGHDAALDRGPGLGLGGGGGSGEQGQRDERGGGEFAHGGIMQRLAGPRIANRSATRQLSQARAACAAGEM